MGDRVRFVSGLGKVGVCVIGVRVVCDRGRERESRLWGFGSRGGLGVVRLLDDSGTVTCFRHLPYRRQIGWRLRQFLLCGSWGDGVVSLLRGSGGDGGHLVAALVSPSCFCLSRDS